MTLLAPSILVPGLRADEGPRAHGLCRLGDASERHRVNHNENQSRNRALGTDLAERRALPIWTDALRGLVAQAESLGVLLVSSSIAANNTTRKIEPEEFWGFAFVDDFAPSSL